MLQAIHKRGVQEVLLFVSDGLRGLRESCLSIFSNAQYQPYLVHMTRNVLSIVRAKDKYILASSLKEVYQAPKCQEAQMRLLEFIRNYQHSCPKLKALLEREEYLFTYHAFCKVIQRSIYSTNVIEGNLRNKQNEKNNFPIKLR